MVSAPLPTLLRDDLDRQIIALLSANARTSFGEIGRRVGLSAPAVKRRVDRLLAVGVIRGFTVVLEPAAVGAPTEAFVELSCRGTTNPDDVRDLVAPYPEVVAAYTVSGDADALLHLRTGDVRDLERTLEQIRSDRRTDRTKSVIVLSRLLERATQMPQTVA